MYIHLEPLVLDEQLNNLVTSHCCSQTCHVRSTSFLGVITPSIHQVLYTHIDHQKRPGGGSSKDLWDFPKKTCHSQISKSRFLRVQYEATPSILVRTNFGNNQTIEHAFPRSPSKKLQLLPHQYVITSLNYI